jgi:hypothetical protein
MESLVTFILIGLFINTMILHKVMIEVKHLYKLVHEKNNKRTPRGKSK